MDNKLLLGASAFAQKGSQNSAKVGSQPTNGAPDVKPQLTYKNGIVQPANGQSLVATTNVAETTENVAEESKSLAVNEATKENPNDETIPEPNNSAVKADVQPKMATPSGGVNPDKLSYMSSSAPKADNELQEENNQLDLQ